MKTSLDIVKELHEIQGRDGNWNYNSYMLGIYNGMELLLATLENRDPVYRTCPANGFVEERLR